LAQRAVALRGPAAQFAAALALKQFEQGRVVAGLCGKAREQRLPLPLQAVVHLPLHARVPDAGIKRQQVAAAQRVLDPAHRIAPHLGPDHRGIGEHAQVTHQAAQLGPRPAQDRGGRGCAGPGRQQGPGRIALKQGPGQQAPAQRRPPGGPEQPRIQRFALAHEPARIDLGKQPLQRHATRPQPFQRRSSAFGLPCRRTRRRLPSVTRRASTAITAAATPSVTGLIADITGGALPRSRSPGGGRVLNFTDTWLTSRRPGTASFTSTLKLCSSLRRLAPACSKMTTEADASPMVPPIGSRSGRAMCTRAEATPAYDDSVRVRSCSQPHCCLARSSVAEDTKPWRWNTSHSDCSGGLGRPRACSASIAYGKSLRLTRIWKPVSLLTELRLSALIPLASSTARTSL